MTWNYAPELARIADALERIATALERANELGTTEELMTEAIRTQQRMLEIEEERRQARLQGGWIERGDKS